MDIKTELLKKLRPEFLEIVIKLLKDIETLNANHKMLCGYHQEIAIAKILVEAYNQKQSCEMASIEFQKR